MPIDNTLKTQDAGDLLRRYQTGELSDDEQKALDEQYAKMPSARQRMRSLIPSANVDVQDYTQQARAQGFGTSRYDTDFYPEADLEEGRALQQSGASKIINGALKGGVTAATTAVNTVAGTLWGAAVGAYKLADNLANGVDEPFKNAIDAGVNNSISTAMMDIQKLSEKWFPNYRTQEERSDEYQRQWIKHVFTPNFIGDSFLKNFGFTVGAMAGGMAWGRVLSMAARTKLAGDLLKGVTAAAAGDAEAEGALTAALEAFRAGSANRAQIDLIKNNIKGAAKRLNRLSATQGLMGATISAMGEGITEGIMAKQEFIDDFDARNNPRFEAEYTNLANQIIQEGNPLFVTLDSYADENGNIIEMRPRLTDAGVRELHKREQELTGKQQALRLEAERQGDRLASTTFALNIPVLTLTNTLEFGRMLSGGWKTARNLTRSVGGGLEKDAAGKIAGNFTGKGSKALGTIAGMAKVGTAEASEEMIQGFISSGAKNVADARLTAFNDDGYDNGVAEDYADWVGLMTEGGMEYLRDWKNWQEGFMGMVTGLIGMPGKGYFSGERGGVMQAYKDASEKVEESRDLANRLNAIVNSDDFQKRWHGYARHNLYEKQMEAAVANNDEYSWHTANDKQAINDIMTFADAGRLNDLYEIVDSYATMSDSDARAADVLEAVKSQKTEKEVDNNPEATLENVRKHAQEFKDFIKDYRETYEAVRTIAPLNVSDEHLKEWVFTAMQTKRFEQRYFDILKDVLNGIEPVIKSSIDASESTKEKSDKEKYDILKSELTKYAQDYSDLALPSSDDPTRIVKFAKALSWLANKTKDNKALSRKVEDLRKLSGSRRAFFQKFEDLGSITSSEFHEQAKNQEKQTKEIQEKAIEKEAEGYDSIDAVRNAYNAIPDADETGRKRFMKDLLKMKDNPYVKRFLKLNSLHEDFNDSYNKMPDRPESDSPVGVAVKYITDSLFNDATLESDIFDDYDNVMPSRANIRQQLKGVFGNTYGDTQIEDATDSAIGIVRNIIQGMRDTNNYHSAPAENDPFILDREEQQGDDGRGTPFVLPGRERQLRRGRTPKKSVEQVDGSVTDVKGRNWKIGDKVYLYSVDGEWQLIPDSVRECVIKNIKKTKTKTEASLVLADGSNKSAYLINLDTNEAIKMQTSPIIAKPKEEQKLQPEEVSVAPVTKQGAHNEMAQSAAQSGIPEGAEEGADESKELTGFGELPYYHQSVPEIDSFQAKDAREIAHDPTMTPAQKAEKIAALDLRDFAEKNPEYKETWDALADLVSPSGEHQNAFENIAYLVKPGDKVKFAIDTNFPKDADGNVQVLVLLDKGGENDKILTVLHAPTERNVGQYKGIADLQRRIRDAYDANPEEGLFVFKKEDGTPYTSDIYLKRNGFVVYGDNEQSIVYTAGNADKHIPSYDANAPIMFIGRNGVPVRLHGSREGTNTTQLERLIQTLYSMGGKSNPTGNLYYLAKDSTGQYSIPIRLGVEHYNKDTKKYSEPTFEKINDGIGAIVDLLSNAKIGNDEALEATQAELRELVKTLGQTLDLHDIVFHVIRDEKTGIPRLMIFNNRTKVKPTSRDLDRISFDWLSDFIAKMDLSINIKADTSIEEYLRDGIITSNATAMRPKGVDFCFNAWDESKEDFVPTDKQNEIKKVQKEEVASPTEPEPEETPAPVEAPKPKAPVGKIDKKKSPSKKKEEKPKQETGATITWDDSWKDFNNLPEQIRKDLEDAGCDESAWNEMGTDDKKQAINCPI